MPSRFHAFLTSLFAGCLAFTVRAQTPAPSAPAEPLVDEIIELSPFVVQTSADTGYAAQETLSGTRLRTSLRDVSASLAVLTQEFLQDLAVTSYDQALLYTPSVDTVDGDNSDANRASGGYLRFGSGQAFSIRGFVTNNGEQSASSDFFTALVPNDVYNFERATLSRGPNSILFGVGGAEGVAVTSIKRAQYGKRKGQVTLQFDRWGSYRTALDYNLPVVENVLALRINALHARKEEFRKFEGSEQTRLTLGAVFNPFKNTRITLNHEVYSNDRNPVPLVHAFDGGVLQWMARGRPTVQFQPRATAWTTANRPFTDASGNRVPVAPGVIDADGFVDAEADFDPQDAFTQITAHTPSYVTGLNLPNPLVNYRWQTSLRANVFGGISSTNFHGVDPFSLYGIPLDANLAGGTWDVPSQSESGNWTHLFIEQKLAPGLFLELGGNLAEHDKSFTPDTFNVIKLDVDRYLPDGSPNPGFMQPYAETAGQYRDQWSDVSQLRASLAYELDLTDRNRWLGAHTFGLLAQTSRTDFDQDVMRVLNRATASGGTGFPVNALAAQNFLRGRAYIVDGVVPELPDQNFFLQNLDQMNALGNMAGGSAVDSARVDFAMRPFINSTKSRSDLDSLSFAWQARWLSDRLITTFGYRRDDSKSYGVPALREWADPAIPNSPNDINLRYYSLSADVPLNETPSVASEGDTRTYGLVYHALPWLSLTYNLSENFQPVGNASWVNFQGVSAPDSVGETEDYGVRLSLFEQRLTVALNYFTNEAGDQARNANASTTNIKNILTRLRTNYKDGGDPNFAAMADAGVYPADTVNVADTWSYVSEGYELSLVYNPSRQWRISVSGSKNTNTLGTHLASLGEYLATDVQFQGLGTWRGYVAELRKVAGGQPSNAFDLDPADPTDRARATTDADYIELQANSAERVYLDELATEGVTTNRNGKYALNSLVTYTFPSVGRLKGLSIGGNFRWRSANTLGYERFDNAAGAPEGVLNVSRPIKGDDFLDVGAMIAYSMRVGEKVNMRLQLNIQNLLNDTDPRLVSSDTDSQGLLGPQYAIVPIRWELKRPRNLVLTTTFDF